MTIVISIISIMTLAAFLMGQSVEKFAIIGFLGLALIIYLTVCIRRKTQKCWPAIYVIAGFIVLILVSIISNEISVGEFVFYGNRPNPVGNSPNIGNVIEIIAFMAVILSVFPANFLATVRSMGKNENNLSK